MEDQPNPMIEALRKLVSEEKRYPLEAYCFLYQALDHAQRGVGQRRHVSGQELLEGAKNLAIELFGPLTLMVFDHWKLKETQDFGRMVFHLVERDLMGKTEEDKVEDFEGLYDFREAFAPENLVVKVDAAALEPSPRLQSRRPPSSKRAHAKQG